MNFFEDRKDFLQKAERLSDSTPFWKIRLSEKNQKDWSGRIQKDLVTKKTKRYLILVGFLIKSRGSLEDSTYYQRRPLIEFYYLKKQKGLLKEDQQTPRA